MNWRAIRAIVRKDLTVVTRSRGVLLPLIIVPIVMLIVLPGLTVFAPSLVNVPGMDLDELDQFLDRMPSGLKGELAGYDEAQQMVVLALVYLLAPFYLMVPLMVASVIAADSFAGEKERKTLEALIYTPTSDLELFIGKLLAAWVPAVGVALGGFVLYSLVANLAAWPVVGRALFPNPMWAVLVLWVAPAVSGMGLGATVLVSARATTFQEASQLGGVVVIPVILLVVGQAAGVMYFNLGLVFLLGLILWGVDGLLIWLGARGFERETVLTRL
jgi:ABC-type Na+ efflux pump permease subunit